VKRWIELVLNYFFGTSLTGSYCLLRLTQRGNKLDILSCTLKGLMKCSSWVHWRLQKLQRKKKGWPKGIKNTQRSLSLRMTIALGRFMFSTELIKKLNDIEFDDDLWSISYLPINKLIIKASEESSFEFSLLSIFLCIHDVQYFCVYKNISIYSK